MEALAAADTKPVASPLWRGTIAIVRIGLILQWLVRDHTADLWLIPTVHFRAMLNATLYELMA